MRVTHQEEDKGKVEISVGGLTQSADEKLARHKSDKFFKSGEKVRALKGLNPNMKRKLSRKINKVHRTVDGEAESKQIFDEQLSGYVMFDVATPPYNLDYLSKLYEISAAHKAAVDAKVSNIVGLGYSWEESLKLQQDLERIDDPDELAHRRRLVERAKERMDDWLEHLNHEDVFEESLRKVWTDVETMGNGYLEIGRTATGAIGYIGHIPANTMRIRTKRDGFVQIVSDRVVYFRNFGSDTPNPVGDDANPNEIIHFKKYSAGQTYYGVPDIMAAKNAVAGNEFASRFNLDYFEHKAVPRYIIIMKGAELSEESENKLINFFSSSLKGQHHRTMFIPLPEDPETGSKVEFRMEAVETQIQDASFEKYYKMNREEILMAHRVPQTKVGLTQDVNLAVARDSDKMFKEQVTRPAQRVIEKKFNHLFDEKTDAFEFRLTELTLTDEDTKSKIHERYLRHGVMLINEARHELGLSGIEGGDEPGALSPQGRAEQRAQARGTRERDQERTGGPDKDGEGRQAAGEGRQTP